MAAEITLDQMANRLQVLEQRVQEITTQLEKQVTQVPAFQFEFIIQVEGREVWRGQDVDVQYARIRKEHPQAQLTISWHSSPALLV